ncbi:MAG: EFR1 family ferrodoxin [Spirochaetes bacterium]|nr:EFR1 family ferrodoxin [Spirochaetota bacterium]MBN2770296.1 EFR1 family ferrodoxin [Spirochaetota bacterium]
MKNIDIIFFEGDGNSSRVSKLLSASLKNSKTRILDAATLLKTGGYFDGSSALIGLVFPLYSGSPPSTVKMFLDQSRNLTSKHFFIVVLNPLPFKVFSQSASVVTKCIDKKKGNVVALFNIVIPFSGVPDYSAEFLDKVENCILERVSRISNIIEKARSAPLTLTIIGRILTIACSLMYKIMKIYGLKLFVRSSCDSCGLCIRGCPVSAIEMDRGIKFKNHCVLCMRCVNACPQEAIGTKRLTRFFKEPSIQSVDSFDNRKNHKITGLIENLSKAYFENDQY